MKLIRGTKVIEYPVEVFENFNNPTLEQMYSLGFENYIEPPIVNPEPEPTAPVRRLSKLQFVNRFTDAEFVGILAAAKVSPEIEAWYAKFQMATPEMDGTSIDLDDPRTVAGINAFEAVGLIGVGRAAEILA